MDLNYLAIVLAAVIGMIVGALWYSPLMFAKPWMKLMKISDESIRTSDMTKTYGLMFAALVFAAYVLSLVVDAMRADSVLSGAGTGLLVSFGFIVTTSLTSVLFEHKPATLYLINTGYHVVTFMLMGALLAVWR